MRKITRKSVDCFLGAVEWSGQNMQIEVRPFKDEVRSSAVMKLHGNVIARRHVGDQKTLWVCDGNWQTNTTKERLNGLPGVSVNQCKGVWYLNGAEWDGSWTEIARQEPQA